MRASICSIAWRDDPIDAVIPIVSQAGYSGIELWAPHIDRYLAEGAPISQLAEILQQRQLAVPMVSGYYDLANNLPASLESTRRYLGYAQALDASLLRIFTGGGESADASLAVWSAVQEGLAQICNLAEPHGIGCALETHEGHLHDSTETTLRLLREVESQSLCVNLDIFNLFMRGEDPLEAWEQLRPWVRICHLKSGVRQGANWRIGLPLAEGAMDYAAFLRALARARFEGYLSIEWFGDDPTAAAPAELAYLRHVLGDALEERNDA